MYRNLGDSLKAYDIYDQALILTRPQADEVNFNVVIEKAAAMAKGLWPSGKTNSLSHGEGETLCEPA